MSGLMDDHIDEERTSSERHNLFKFMKLFDDAQRQGLANYPGIKLVTIKPQTDRWIFLDSNRGVLVLAEGRLVNLGCGTGNPSFVMSCSFTNQVLALTELWKEKGSGKCGKKEVYLLPKHLDAKVARLHIDKLGGKPTKLTPKQAAYIGVPVEEPYKPSHYRY
ncbi:hypothetical protein HYC85_021179 [Camellia sinensis]|uniref:Adenosylhomocysteinase n=1 Tax=Camellia sinensis TaxID=4442 RepID=A0A7J7GGX2_CAMSI|nr:hypothetical protein HYC85_021179 [Camellia sinensis]